MRTAKSEEIRPVAFERPEPPPSTRPQSPARPSTPLGAPDGLKAREKAGAEAVYTTANMAKRSDRGVFSKLKNYWKASKTTANANLGPLAVGTQTQHPIGRHNQVQAPRFDTDATVPLPNATKTGLAQAVQQALHQVETGQSPDAQAPGWAEQAAGTAKYWTQQALSVLAIGKGPESVPGDALAMFYGTQGFNGSQGGSAGPEAIVLSHLESLVHAEKAKATIHLATQASLPDGERLDTQEALQRLTDASKAAELQSKDKATAANAEMVAELVASAPEALHERLQAAADTLVAALNRGAKVPDVLGVELFINAARNTFESDPEAMVKAMEDLSHSSPARLVGLVNDAFQADANANTDAPAATATAQDPLLRLAVAIARPPAGEHLLDKMTDPPAMGARKTALRVAMRAMVEWEPLRQGAPGTTPAKADIGLLRAAVEHALQQVQPGSAPAVAPERDAAQREAFGCLQNGFTSKEKGSSYDRVRERLLQFSDGALDQTAQRNARAASGRFGRLQNWLTGGLPKAIVKNSTNLEGLLAPALPAIASWLPGAQPTMWRKSVMRKLTAAASENGMLPRRDEAVAALHRTAADMRAHLQTRTGADAAPAETLMLAVLEELKLGAHSNPPSQSTLKHLGKSLFQKVEAHLGAEGMARLSPELAANWQSLRGSRPNVGHLLRLLSEHIDLRAMADGTLSPTVVPTQVARGLRTDAIAHEAIDGFKDIAEVAHAAAQAESEPTQALADLMQASATVLAKVNPPAALRSLRIETFEAIENQLASAWLTTLPEGERPPWHQAIETLQERWPASVQSAWKAMKASGNDAGRLMRTLVDAASAVPWSVPAADPAAASTSHAPRSVADAVAAAAPALQALQRDVHVNRFELCVADTVTLFNDLRGPADAAEVMKSLAQRISLGEKIKSSDARLARLELGKAVSVTTATPELVTPIAGVGLGHERSMDLNMVGAAMQIQIATADSRNASVGLNLGVRGALGHKDHEFNLGDDEAGIALRFDMRFEAGGETSQTQGVSLRMQRTAAHEDALRRQFTDALIAMTQGGGLPPEGGAGPDPLAHLLEHFPALAVAELSNTKRSRTSELAVGANAMVRVRGSRERDDDDRRATRRAIGVGVQAGMSSSAQRSQSVQTESRSGLNVEEYKLSAQHRAEARASANASLGLVPASRHDPEKAAQARGAGVDVRKQLANSGVDTTLRITTRHGETWADQTQMIREFEDLDDFLAELEPRMHEFVSVLATRDGVPDATAAEKTGRAWLRLQDTLVQAAQASAPGMAFSVVTKLRPQAAEAYDKLQGLAQQAAEAGHKAAAAAEQATEAARRSTTESQQASAAIRRAAAAGQPTEALAQQANATRLRALAADQQSEAARLRTIAQTQEAKADGYRAKVRNLLNSHDAWIANNLQFKTKAKDEVSQSAALGILQGKAASESTRLHEFLPAGSQQVGRTPMQHAAAPEDHSARWSPKLPPVARNPIPESDPEQTTETEAIHPEALWRARAETQVSKMSAQANQHAQSLAARTNEAMNKKLAPETEVEEDPETVLQSSETSVPEQPVKPRRPTLGELFKAPFGDKHPLHELPRPPMSASPSFRDWVPEEAAVHQEGALTPPSTSSNAREAPQSYPLPLPPAGSPPPPLRGLRQATLSTSGTRPAPDQSYPLPTPQSVPASRPPERRSTPSAEPQSYPLPTPAQDRAAAHTPGSQPAT
ncbi:hypothetical protein SAMN05192589_104265 [Paracidovorax valerianellae]|uniref:Uncharacterized protein n=1 Tax=Paracidovorax valerianellae TaxID=187868 RepID=A0A1G6RYS3_9BURK|nr:hypothetical protein [Paracidovorax valerianellae]SDD09105.1 hypothetical protein SAMN05192589_104265 [Paracidovorax valerianellae]